MPRAFKGSMGSSGRSSANLHEIPQVFLMDQRDIQVHVFRNSFMLTLSKLMMSICSGSHVARIQGLVRNFSTFFPASRMSRTGHCVIILVRPPSISLMTPRQHLTVEICVNAKLVRHSDRFLQRRAPRQLSCAHLCLVTIPWQSVPRCTTTHFTSRTTSHKYKVEGHNWTVAELLQQKVPCNWTARICTNKVPLTYSCRQLS